MRNTLCFAFVASLSSAACSSATVTPDAANDAATGDTATNDAVAMDTVVNDTGSDVTPADVTHADTGSDAGPSPCPASPVTGACTREGLECTYGDDPRASCRTRLSCTGGMWQLTSPRCVPITGCSPAPTSGAVCANDGDVCVAVDGTRCDCGYCPHGGPACAPIPPAMWFCTPPPANLACPRTMPNLGDPCAATGTSCDYDGCGSGMAVQCSGGIWIPELVACPA